MSWLPLVNLDVWIHQIHLGLPIPRWSLGYSPFLSPMSGLVALRWYRFVFNEMHSRKNGWLNKNTADLGCHWFSEMQQWVQMVWSQRRNDLNETNISSGVFEWLGVFHQTTPLDNTTWYADEFFHHMCILTNTHTQTHTHTNTRHSWFLFHTISPLSLHFECQSIQGADADTCGICVKRYVEQWICFASVMFGLLFSSVTSDVYKKGRFSAYRIEAVTYIGCHFLSWLIRGLRPSGPKFKVLLGSVLCVFWIYSTFNDLHT